MFKVNNKDTRKTRRQGRLSDVFIVKFEHI